MKINEIDFILTSILRFANKRLTISGFPLAIARCNAVRLKIL